MYLTGRVSGNAHGRDDKYPTAMIKDYAHLLQAYSPSLAGMVLQD